MSASMWMIVPGMRMKKRRKLMLRVGRVLPEGVVAVLPLLHSPACSQGGGKRGR